MTWAIMGYLYHSYDRNLWEALLIYVDPLELANHL